MDWRAFPRSLFEATTGALRAGGVGLLSVFGMRDPISSPRIALDQLDLTARTIYSLMTGDRVIAADLPSRRAALGDRKHALRLRLDVPSSDLASPASGGAEDAGVAEDRPAKAAQARRRVEPQVSSSTMAEAEQDVGATRLSTKHAQRVDDDLKRAARSITRGSPPDAGAVEDRREEGTAIDTFGTRGDPSEALDRTDVDGRAAVAARLAPTHYPADRDELIAAADVAGGDDDLKIRLLRLPPTTLFRNFEEVWEAIAS